MFSRKACFVSVAAASLTFGGLALVRAEDKMPDASKMEPKIEEQEKEKADLMQNFNDPGFVKIASMANADEIKASEAVMQMSKNDDVKKFAQDMIDDHGKVGEQMKTLADQKGWKVHDHPDAKHKVAMEQMEKMSGSDLDKSYATAQVRDHEDTVALFKLASEKASDSDLKEFVNKTLPQLEHHLKMARSLENKMSSAADAK